MNEAVVPRSVEPEDAREHARAGRHARSAHVVPRAGEPALDERLGRWVNDHSGELERHLGSMLGNRDEALDVLQEVWIAAVEHRPDAVPGANVRAWLYRVATNRALDRLATRRRRQVLLQTGDRRLWPDGPASPDDSVGRLDGASRARVHDAIERLPPKQRQAVWSRWIDGADYATIARRLDCSEESARANVYNGLKRLRGELFELWKENAG